MRGWIPGIPLALGVCASGLSWVALLFVARGGTFDVGFLALGWLHLVALGWITLVALSVLTHVIPEFTDVASVGSAVARWSILAYAIGVVSLLTGFFVGNMIALEFGATLATVALILYVGLALVTLLRALRGPQLERAVARAFVLTLSCLLFTALLGSGFVYALAGRLPAGLLERLPQAHAVLGIGGWLTLLVMGVSAKTLRPMSGTRSRLPLLHIGGSSCVALGAIVGAVALAVGWYPLAAGAFALVAIGLAAYAIDVVDIATRATVPARMPYTLLATAACMAVVAALLALLAPLGFPTASAAVYLALIGWIGCALIAHLHHIGVRVMLTLVRGDDDETRPWHVLTAPLTWLCALCLVVAATVGTIAIVLADAPLLTFAALAGLLSFVVMIVNLRLAVRNARRLPFVLGTL